MYLASSPSGRSFRSLFLPGLFVQERGQEREKAATLSEVNQGILGVARHSIDGEQEWEFFCECGREDCREYVSLTVDAYSSLRDDCGAVLAPGHRRSPVARARRLCEEAEARRRQAEQQLKRALRNLGAGGNLP